MALNIFTMSAENAIGYNLNLSKISVTLGYKFGPDNKQSLNE